MKYVIKYDDEEKEVSKKHFEKIDKMEDNTKKFFVLCHDFDLNKRYPVAQFELKLKGIDILMMLDLMLKDRLIEHDGTIFKGGLFIGKEGSSVGFLGVNGIKKF